MAKTQNSTIDFYEMTGGLNTVSSAIRLQHNEARDLQNIRLEPIGGFKKRLGYDDLNPTALSSSACTGLYMARYSTAGGTNFAFLVNGTELYSMASDLGGTWTNKTNGLTITAGNNNIWCFDMLNDITVLGNGTNSPIQISSTPTATALTAGLPFTTFRFPVQARGYMWYFVPTVGGTVQYDRGYFSSINDPTVVGSNNYVDIAKGTGGIVAGAVEYKTYLYVFKRHGIYQLNYQPTRVNSSGTLFPWTEFPNPVVPGVGTQSHRSIVKFTTPSTHQTPGQEYVFFVDQYGNPRIFDGQTTIAFTSKIGYSRDGSIKSLADMDRSRNPYTFAVNYPDKNIIRFFLSDAGSVQDTCWVLDYSIGFAVLRDDYYDDFNCAALFEKSDGTFKVYCGDYAGKVYEMDTGLLDNGNTINAYYVTGDVFLKSPSIKSKWYSNEIRGSTGDTSESVSISYYINGEDSVASMENRVLAEEQTEWGDFIWGQASWAKQGLVTENSEINHVAKTLRVKYQNNNSNDTFSIEGFSLQVEPLGTDRS